MANENPLHNFDGLRSEIAHRFGTKKGEQFDFSRVDVATLRAFLKAEYRSMAQKYHPDKLNGFTATLGEIIKDVNGSWSAIEKADNDRLRKYVSDFVNDNSGNEELIARALAALDHSDAQRKVLETRLAETQATLIGLGQGRRYTPDQVVIYEDHQAKIHITLGNARQAIPEIIRRGATNPDLIARLQAAERQVREYQDRVQKSEITIQSYDAEIRRLKDELTREQEKARESAAENATLIEIYEEREIAAGRLIEHLERKAGEVEGLQRRVTDLITKVRVYEKGTLTVEDPLEELLKAQAESTGNPHTRLGYVTHIYLQQASRTEVKWEKIVAAREILSELLQPKDEQLEEAIYALGVMLYNMGHFSFSEGVFHEITKKDPDNSKAWDMLAESVNLSTNKDSNTENYIRECRQNALTARHKQDPLKGLLASAHNSNTPADVRDRYLLAVHIYDRQLKQAEINWDEVVTARNLVYQAVSSKDPHLTEQAMWLGKTLLHVGLYSFAEGVFAEITKANPTTENYNLLIDSITQSPDRQRELEELHSRLSKILF